MKAIVKVLLEKGIDEQTIHEVLDIIQEVEIPNFMDDAETKQRKANNDAYISNMKNKEKTNRENKEKVQAGIANIRKAARGEKYKPAGVIK